MQLVHRLTFPSIYDVSDPDQLGPLLARKYKHNHYAWLDAKTFLRHEHRSVFEFEWDLILFFHKKETGTIHTDTNVEGRFSWGLNFVVGAPGVMHFWQPENVARYGTSPGVSDGSGNGSDPIFRPCGPPSFSYEMTEGVYLVNTTLPHNVTPRGPRFTFSFRVANPHEHEWEHVVNKFVGA